MKAHVKNAAAYCFLILLGIVMIYPLLWIFASSFKSNDEIFTNVGLIPSHFTADSYLKGWKASGQYTYGTFFLNTFKLVIPTVLFTILSSCIVAYGFARFRFPLKKIMFALVIATLLLPNEIIIIPRYILFKNFGWLNSYWPFIIPALFGTYSFFIFMMLQFIRGIPRELDESARIDGCNSFAILWRIILPLCKPAIFSIAIFQFVWRWNDFLNVLIYVNSVAKFPISLALRMSMDVTGTVAWNQLMAMSILCILPPMLIFFLAQKYFVEGISTTGIKG
ncbi:carbohydrate ABC transporter permease [Paenibacillus thalictri]|uniref:Carbohydrate ABC transporter permease n=1 Tax=Paenibacillus thalictri TaxID=2527873 RepID=A0A4Q9DUE0_9BACL|nr:carbohydrate ABC transporter permease [Paenibacillus thalictri]TBL80597.1 carbohydrate ABC transporter permease [Paenibacillus thalictri]